MFGKNGSKVFNRADYWKNVLNYNHNQIVCLILQELSEKDYEFIKDNFWINFVIYAKPVDINLKNLIFKNGELKFSPDDLKNINYALYSGEDKNIIYPLLASGITVIKEFGLLETQESIERVNNFSMLDNLT